MPETLLSVVLFLALVAVVGVLGIRAGIIVARRVDARLERAEEDDEPGD